MKKGIAIVIAVFFVCYAVLAVSCAKKSPTEAADPTATATATTAIPPSTVPPFNFETSIDGFTTDGAGSPAISLNTNITYTYNASAGSIRLDFGITTAGNEQLYLRKTLAPAIDMTNKRYALMVYIPADLANKGIGANIFINTPSWVSKWVNIDTAGWVKIELEPGLANVTEIGIQFDALNTNADWTGAVFVDYVTVSDVPPLGTADYGFNTTTEGMLIGTTTGETAVNEIVLNADAGFIKHGAGSMSVSVTATSANPKGYIYWDFASSPQNLTNKTVEVHFYVPAGMNGYGAHLVAKTGAALDWHSGWVNLTTGWVKGSWFVNLADVQQLGIMFDRNGTADFDGIIYVDEYDIRD